MFLILPFDDSFNNARMVRSKVNETVSDSSLPQGLEEGKGRSIHDDIEGAPIRIDL